MASLINSIRNIVNDRFWILKLGVFTAVLFFIMYNSYDYASSQESLIAVYVFLIAIGLGYSSVLINRNINNKTPILPGLFSIADIFLKAIVSTILAAPGAVAYYFSVNYLSSNFEFEPVLGAVFYILLTLIFLPFIIIPVVLYSAKGNILDGYRVNLIIKSAGNFIVQSLSYLIQYVLIFIPATLILYFALLEIFGDHVSLLILKCIAITITFFSVFSFCSDLYGDTIVPLKEKEKPKKKLKRKVP